MSLIDVDVLAAAVVAAGSAAAAAAGPQGAARETATMKPRHWRVARSIAIMPDHSDSEE
jgi:hypothetical protein